MQRLLLVLLIALIAGNAAAIEMAGVAVAPQVNENGRPLQLNGCGIRSKYFVKIYVGALYTTRRMTTPAELYADNGDKLLRMHFVYDGVSEEKIVATFDEGLVNNAPQVAASDDARRFLALFAGSGEVHAGDTVDLLLGGDGNVTVRYDGRAIGSLRSSQLLRGILAVYVGEHPADADLKRGLLGAE